ncbi:MAG: ABC transporter ATP-binding protein [Bacteroidota bacterium]
MKRWLNDNLIIKSLTNIYRLLTPAQRRKSFGMLFLILTLGLLDVFGLASILPIIYLTTKTELIYSNIYLNSVYTFFNFHSPNAFILFIFFIVVILYTVKNLLAVWINYSQVKFSYEVASNITARKLKQFFTLDVTEIISKNSSVFASNISASPAELSSGLMVPLFSFLSELIVILLIVVAISILDYKLLILLSVILIPTTIIFYRAIRNRSHNMGLQKNNARYFAFQYLYQIIHGYIDVILMNKVSHYSKKFTDKNKELNSAYTQLTFYESIPNRYIEVIALIAIFMIFAYSVFMQVVDSNFIAFLAIFVTSAYRILPSFNRIIVSIVRIKSNQIVFDILKDIPADEKGIDVFATEEESEIFLTPSFNQSIELKNIKYSYHSSKKPALENISVKIKKGDIVGFIGTSGSGKTTLFNILLRLLVEQKGELLIDGKPINEDYLIGWRKMIGYVRQDYFLIDATLAENIAFGISREKIDEKKLLECIKLSSLDDFVKALPKGIDNQIGEKGSKLSGGQKQRIAIARSLYHDSEIILFDEATSALDHETENEIIETINNLFAEKKTMLMIAHRYTTLRKCDRIYELKDGNIIAVHTYDDLIRQRIQVN